MSKSLICGVLLVAWVLPLGGSFERAGEQPQESQPVNPVGERPEHQALGSATFPQLLQKYENWSGSMLRYFEAVNSRLAEASDATYIDLSADPVFLRLAAENGVTHLGGPMLGSVSPHGASVWVRTLRPATVEVNVTVGGEEKRFGPVRSSADTDLSAVVQVNGLRPGTVHPYKVLIDGRVIPIPSHAAIMTTPEGELPARTRIAFGSCFHRWGLGNVKQAELIRSRRPDALLLCGDIASQDKGKHRGLARGDYFMRDAFSAWRNLVAAVPVYAAWDDHDYLDNDLAGIPEGYTREDQRKTWEVFRNSWANPAYGFGDDRRGIFLRARIGACDVLMLDTRYFRQKDNFLGPEQMRWLEAQLLDCKGPFIILTSGTMWSDYVSAGKDSWGVWDAQGRERLFRFVEENRIGGVLLVSGDRHGARGFRIPRPAGFSFYEFEPASLGGRSGPVVSRPEWKDVQLFGYSAIYAFGEFTVDASVPDPEVTFRLIREDGKILEELMLKRSQLTPGQ